MRDPKHILITGASSGLGAALALDYAAPGMCLSLHGRNADRLAQVAAQATKRGSKVSIPSGDVADRTDMENWMTARDNAAEIDLIIANAGLSGGTSASTGGGETVDQVAAIFAANVTGVFNTVQPALARMGRRRRGQIAIVSSLARVRTHELHEVLFA